VFKKNRRNVNWRNPRNLRNYLNLCSKINVGTVRQFECFLWRASEQKMYREPFYIQKMYREPFYIRVVSKCIRTDRKKTKIQMFKQIFLIISMGIFGNLFGQKKHTENFESYFRITNNLKQFIVVDTGLNTIAPVNSKQNVLKMSFQMLNIDDEG
jgi:hypothetical protein